MCALNMMFSRLGTVCGCLKNKWVILCLLLVALSDEPSGGITPIAAAMTAAVHPAEPPPPYTLYASNLRSTPLVAGQNQSQSTSGTATHPSIISGTINGANTRGNAQNALETNVQRIIRGDDVRRSGPSVLSYAPPQTNLAFDIQSGWRERTIHQSLRLSSEQSANLEWSSRSAHQRRFDDSELDESETMNISDEDPSIVPAELYRDQIRRSGHRYSLSDPTLQSRNSRNRQGSRHPLDATQNQNANRTANNAANVDTLTPREREVIATVHRQNESTPNSHIEQRGNSPRRHQGPPPPYEGRHNVVRTHSNSLNQTVIDSRHSRDRNEDSPSHYRSQSSNRRERDNPSHAINGEQFQGSAQIRTSPRTWRVEDPQDAIYETIPSPQSSPTHRQQEIISDRSRQPEGDYPRTRNTVDVSVNPVHQQGVPSGNRSVNVVNYSTSWGIEIEEDDEVEDDDAAVVRSGSWRWAENVAPVTVTSRPSEGRQDFRGDHRSVPDQESSSGPETRTMPIRQPPLYCGRRQPSCAPPPYKPRNRSLPNYARRQNLTSPPPPYQGHQQRSTSVDASDRTRSAAVHEWNDGDRTTGRAVQEISQPSDRVGSGQTYRESDHSQRPGTRDTLPTGNLQVRTFSGDEEHYSHRVQSFREPPQPILSHSLPRMAVSSLAISPPSSSSSSMRTASPSPRQNLTSPCSSSTVAVSPTRLTFSESSSAFSPSLSSSSSSASPRAYREVWLEPPKRAPKRSSSSTSYSSSYRDARQSSAVAPVSCHTQPRPTNHALTSQDPFLLCGPCPLHPNVPFRFTQPQPPPILVDLPQPRPQHLLNAPPHLLSPCTPYPCVNQRPKTTPPLRCIAPPSRR